MPARRTHEITLKQLETGNLAQGAGKGKGPKERIFRLAGKRIRVQWKQIIGMNTYYIPTNVQSIVFAEEKKRHGEKRETGSDLDYVAACKKRRNNICIPRTLIGIYYLALYETYFHRVSTTIEY